ncbi:DUF4375 domain-containing protein [Polaromonas sp. SP1]|uniref:DMP19 family protein n=1 Tax=Polaromonas sp. SP1 TaxID=2268087 RepID=UPI00351529C8
MPSRHLFAVHWCQSEICNGGFMQFFANSTGVLAPEVAFLQCKVVSVYGLFTLVRVSHPVTH